MSSSGPTLPPQAYTREMLSVAFQWLQSQPESIKRLAQTPDALVGLFMRAQRFGHSAPETDAPVTSQNFISDLKNLAEGLKQFESPEPKTAPTPTTPAAQVPTKPIIKAEPKEPTTTGAQASAPRTSTHGASMNSHAVTNMNPFQHAPAQPQQASPLNVPQSFHIPQPVAAQFAPTAMLSAHLNSSAQCMIQEVKTHLNLSSDAEVLNMMVALAYKNIKTLLG